MAKTLYVMRDIDLFLGDEATGPNFKCEVSKVEINGDTPVVKAEAACPNGQYSAVGNTTYEIRVTYLNLVESEPSGADNFFDFLLQHAGEKMPLTWRLTAGGKGYKADVTIPGGSFSGDVSGKTDATVTFPCDGKPTKISAKG